MGEVTTENLARGLAKRYKPWAAEHITPRCKTLEQVQIMTAAWLTEQVALPHATMRRIAKAHISQKSGTIMVRYAGIASAILKQVRIAKGEEPKRGRKRTRRKRKGKR